MRPHSSRSTREDGFSPSPSRHPRPPACARIRCSADVMECLRSPPQRGDEPRQRRAPRAGCAPHRSGHRGSSPVHRRARRYPQRPRPGPSTPRAHRPGAGDAAQPSPPAPAQRQPPAPQRVMSNPRPRRRRRNHDIACAARSRASLSALHDSSPFPVCLRSLPLAQVLRGVASRHVVASGFEQRTRVTTGRTRAGPVSDKAKGGYVRREVGLGAESAQPTSGCGPVPAQGSWTRGMAGSSRGARCPVTTVVQLRRRGPSSDAGTAQDARWRGDSARGRRWSARSRRSAGARCTERCVVHGIIAPGSSTPTANAGLGPIAA